MPILLWQTVGAGLFQWSPQGRPIRPHFAKSLESVNGGMLVDGSEHLEAGVRETR